MSVSEELLDVVDADDQVIGVSSRGEIHARGLMHRAVHILVFNHQGQVFLQKRSMSKDEQPGKWDSSAAGHVDSGESYLQCAHREIAEELGIPAAHALEVLFKLPASKPTGNEHCVVYRCDYDGALLLAPDEIDDGVWLAPTTLDQRVLAGDAMLTGAIRQIWRQFRELPDKSA